MLFFRFKEILTSISCTLVVVTLFFSHRAIAENSKTPIQGSIQLSYEQRMIVSYTLLAYGQTEEKKSEIYNRMTAQIQKYLSEKVQTIQVRTFAEFLKLYKGSWPNAESLETELNLLENRIARGFVKIESSNPNIQKKIDQFYSEQLTQNMMAFKKLSIPINIQNVNEDFIIQTFKKKNLGPAINSFIQLGNGYIEQILLKLDNMGDIISNQRSETSKENQGYQLFIEKFFSIYFKELSLETKKLMLSALMESPLNLSSMDQFEILIQNSGPLLQKFLQVIGRKNMFPADIGELFKRLEDSVKPVPWEIVEKLLEKEKSNYNFISFEEKPLGVGTMAQVHRAKIQLENGKIKSVVVRFMKPNIAKRIAEDSRILFLVAHELDQDPRMKAAGFPPLTPLVEDVTKTATDELNQKETEKRQKIAAPAYNKEILFKTIDYKNTLEFHVPELLSSKKHSDLMVQEMVFGQKLEKNYVTWENIIPSLKSKIAEELTSLWLEELIFGKGFYHSDLHQGNFILQMNDQGFRLNILDFGMGGVISKEMQKVILRLGVAIELEDSEQIAKEYWKARDKSINNVSFSELSEIVKTILHHKTQKMTPNEWTVKILSEGFKLSYDMISVNRGIETLATLLETSGSLENVRSLTKKIALKNPIKLYTVLVVEDHFSSIDLMSLGWLDFKQRWNQNTGNTKDVSEKLCSGIFR